MVSVCRRPTWWAAAVSLAPSAMAKSARARSTWAAGALSERLRRVKAIRSSGVSGAEGLSGGATWDTSGHEDRLATIPDLLANDPLVSPPAPGQQPRGASSEEREAAQSAPA